MDTSNEGELSVAVPKPPVKKKADSQNEGGGSSSAGETSAALISSEATENPEEESSVSLFSSFAKALKGTKVILGQAPFGYGAAANPFGAGPGAPCTSSLFRSGALNRSAESVSVAPNFFKLFGSSDPPESEAPSSSTQTGSGTSNSSTLTGSGAPKSSNNPGSGPANSSTRAESEAPNSFNKTAPGAPDSSTQSGSGLTNRSTGAESEAPKDSTQSKSGAPNSSTSAGAGAPNTLTTSESGAQNSSTQSGSEVPNKSSTVAGETQANGAQNAEGSSEKGKQPENPPPVSTVAVPQIRGTGNTKTVDCCQKLLTLLRELRRTVKMFREETQKFTGSIEHKMFIGRLNRRLLTKMNMMVEVSKDLPVEVPRFREMEMMNIFHEEAFRGLDFQIKMDAVEDKSNWWNGEYHHIHFYTQFMPHHKVACPAQIPRPSKFSTSKAQQRHRYYLLVYSAVNATETPFSFGFQSKVLEFNIKNSLIEFKIVEKRFPKVCVMKLLVLEHLGDIVYINIAAPDQRWDKQDNGYGPRKLEPFTKAVHEVYKKFTIDANAKMMTRSDMIANLNREKFLWFIWLFAQYRTLFRAKCHGCQNILHNFMPPTTFDKTGKPYHEACMYRVSFVPGMFQYI